MINLHEDSIGYSTEPQIGEDMILVPAQLTLYMFLAGEASITFSWNRATILAQAGGRYEVRSIAGPQTIARNQLWQSAQSINEY